MESYTILSSEKYTIDKNISESDVGSKLTSSYTIVLYYSNEKPSNKGRLLEGDILCYNTTTYDINWK